MASKPSLAQLAAEAAAQPSSNPMTNRNAQALQKGWERIANGKPKHKSHRTAKGRPGASRQAQVHSLQRLESLEDELRSQHGNTGANRWMIPYADLLTLLLGLFLMLMALATQHSEFLEGVTSNLTKDLQVQQNRVAEQQAELLKMQEALGLLASEQTESAVMMTQPADVIANDDITVSQDERGLVITLLDSVLFTPGSAELSPSAKATLTKVAKQLKPMPNDIRVEGHTDNTPINTAIFPNNWYLSTARATQIVEYLINGHQFSPKRLSAAGYGEHHPVAENSSIEGKRQNRRVDIIVLDPQPVLASSRQAKPLGKQVDGIRETQIEVVSTGSPTE